MPGFEQIHKIDVKKAIIIILLIGLSLRAFDFYMAPEYNRANLIGFSLAVKNLGNKGNLCINNWVWSEGFVKDSEKSCVYSHYTAIGFFLAALPFYYISGNAFLAIKLLSFLFGMLLLVVAYFVFKGIFDKNVAMYATLFCAFSFVLIHFSINGSAYMLVSLLSVLYILFLLNLHRLKWFGFFIFGLFIPASILIYSGAMAIVFSFMLLLIIEKGLRKHLRHRLLSFSLGLLTGILMFFVYHELIFGTLIPPQVSITVFDFVLGGQASGGSFIEDVSIYLTNIIDGSIMQVFFVVTIFSVSLPFILGGILNITKKINVIKDEKRLAVLGIITFLVCQFFLVFSIGMYRHIVPTVPFLLLFSAYYLAGFRNKELATLFILSFIFVSIIPIIRYPYMSYHTPIVEHERIRVNDFLSEREMLELLNKEETGLVLDVSNSFLGLEILYYTNMILIDGTHHRESNNVTGIRELVSSYYPLYAWTDQETLDLFLDEYSIILQGDNNFILKRKS
jgi:hypothetical protein